MLDDNLKKPDVCIKSGDENFSLNGKPLGFSLLNFWRWNCSDLLNNTLRGHLAEFIVANAVGSDLSRHRQEWDSFDLISSEGITIEVKSAAYLQSWHQNSYSNISFSIKQTRSWNPHDNTWTQDLKRQADIYVFCLLKHKIGLSINPLDLNQWCFYILSSKTINQLWPNNKSISLSSIVRYANDLSYLEIHKEILKQTSSNENI